MRWVMLWMTSESAKKNIRTVLTAKDFLVESRYKK